MFENVEVRKIPKLNQLQGIMFNIKSEHMQSEGKELLQQILNLHAYSC